MRKRVLTHNQGYQNSMTGRRRKLSDGAMLDICAQYAKGASVVALAESYGVSTHLIYTVVYWTPREATDES